MAFKPYWHGFLPKQSDGDLLFIPLGTLLMVDLHTLVTPKVFIITGLCYHLCHRENLDTEPLIIPHVMSSRFICFF